MEQTTKYASLLFAVQELKTVLTKRTIIGNIVGGIVTAMGVAALILALGLQESQIEETIPLGEFTSYQFNAPRGAQESILVTGDTFDVEIFSPGYNETISGKDREEAAWTTASDGLSRIAIQNTGQQELQVSGTLQYATDPILYTYHVMVIVAGVVIVGFSAGFSIRKPKGF